MIAAAYSDVRRDFILVHVEPEGDAHHVLLRVTGSASSMSWRLQTDDIDRSLHDVAEALGPTALFDVGTSFDPAGARLRSAAFPTAWPNRYLLHVGGTRRCLVVDRETADVDIERAFAHAEDDYFANDFRPATE